jgi:hypothetical protein
MVIGIQSRILAAWLAILVGWAAWCPAAEVEARLDRDSVTAGNGALLTVRISGGRAGQPEIPAVENLIIDLRGQNPQMQLFNGRTTVSVTYQYAVGSNIPGDYQIPAINFTVDGQQLSTQPLKLKVLDAAAAKPPPGIPPNPAASQPAGDEPADSGDKRFGFLTVELAASARKHAYVGEIAPVRIQAWFPIDSRAQLRSGVQPEGKAFTLHHVSDAPQQTQEIRDGKRYLVVTWYGGISATKAGKYPASLSVQAVVAVRDTSAANPRMRTGSPFDDMFVPTIQKEVTLKSDDQQIEVRPLPTQGRPAGFTGAVGEFKIDGWEIPNKWTTGEPQQIQALISGSGNFALMDAPELAPAEAWKTYPGKDDFTPGDVASFAGSKRFQFSAVPRKGGAQEAALAFSFFDPAAGDYKTLTSPTKNIQVAGETIADDPATDNPATGVPVKKDSSLVAEHHELSPAGSLIPLVSRPAFSTMLVFSGVLWVAGIILAWFRIRRENPQRRALAAMEKATREALHRAGQCAAAGDVPGFFAAARLAIQQRLGALWNQPPQAITLAEVNARIPHDSPVARFFDEADRHTYSSQSSGEILPQWKTLLDESLASLTTSVR